MAGPLIREGWQRPLSPDVPVLDMEHPCARGLRFGMLFNHPSARYLGDTSGAGNVATESLLPFWGSTARRAVSVSLFDGIPRTASYDANGIYHSTRDGHGVVMASTDTINFGPDPMPTGPVTICLIAKTWQVQDGLSFGVSSATAAKQGKTLLPFDGNCYWDWGGSTSGTSRLIVASPAGLVSNDTAHRWVFTAGPAGMAMWFNGVKIGSHATASPGRTADTAVNFHIGTVPAAGSGNRQQLFLFQVNEIQWPDVLCQQWSAEPYAHLSDPDWHAWAVASAAGGPTAKPWLYGPRTHTLGAGFARGTS